MSQKRLPVSLSFSLSRPFGRLSFQKLLAIQIDGGALFLQSDMRGPTINVTCFGLGILHWLESPLKPAILSTTMVVVRVCSVVRDDGNTAVSCADETFTSPKPK